MCICGKVIDGRDKYRTYLSEVATYSLLFRFCDANGLPLFSPSNEVLGVLFHSTGHNPPPRQDIPATRKSLARSKATQLQTEMANFHPSKEMKLACQWNGNHQTGGLTKPCLITQKQGDVDVEVQLSSSAGGRQDESWNTWVENG